MNSVRRATDIPKAVKDRVYERDGGRCIFCGRPGMPNAHFISRAQLGKGIEENIVTACFECHRRMDQFVDRKEYLEAAEEYLRGIYPHWNMEALIYKKGDK